MKGRIGFVSNSSSSSFCIIGIDKWARSSYDYPIPEMVWLADGKSLDEDKMYDYFGYGHEEGKHFSFYGTYEVNYVGADAEKLLQDKTIPQAKVWFKEEIKRLYDLDVDESAIKFHVGEEGEG